MTFERLRNFSQANNNDLLYLCVVLRLGKTLLNLEDFIKDVKNAYEKLIDNIKKDEELFENAKFKLQTEGTLMVLAQSNLTS